MSRGFVYGPDEGVREPFAALEPLKRLKGSRSAQSPADDLGVIRDAEPPVVEAKQSTQAGEPPAKAAGGADSYGDRLVKYIPAEVLVFFLAAAGQWGTHDAFLVVTLVLAVVFTPIVIYAASPGGLRWYTVLLAVIAFGAWAVGTSANTDRLVGLPVDQAPFILTAAAFAIPAADKALGKALRGNPR
jgi:hypothetical protein